VAMRRSPDGCPDPWPAGPVVTPPVLVAQSWSDAVFLHWRIPASAAERYMPPLVKPDVFLGSTWVGLIGFRLHGTRIGGAVPVPWLGSFTEVNVRLYTRGADGSRGVLFLSLDASRLGTVLAARAIGVPYVFSRCRPRHGPGDDVFGYDVKRFRGQGSSSFAVRPDFTRQAGDRLSLELTARFGAHARLAGRTLFVPNSHRPWPLHPAHLISFDDGLLRSSGFPMAGPPESVLFSPGVRTVFGPPRAVQRSGAGRTGG
jgi:uncharacterized protein YqjF (DUF2071 family)